MRVRVTRLNPLVPLPVYSSSGAAAFDLTAADDVEIPPRQIRLVGTGLVVQVPPGYFLAIFARSSTPLKRGIMVANGVGVVDSDYRGPTDEVKVQMLNFTDEIVRIARGDRLAQGMILASPRVEFDETAEIVAADRGGFGSTG